VLKAEFPHLEDEMRRQARLFFLGLVLGGIAIGAQEPSPTAPAAPAGEFGASIDVRTVNVEVVVTDRKGDRVPGLKATDFRLTVDGHQVPLDYFTEVQGAPAAGTTAAAETAPPISPSESAPASAAAAPSSPEGTSYLVFVDEASAVASDRDLMLRLLARDLPVGAADQMAIVAFDGHKLDLVRDWTEDREVLRRTLQEIQGRTSHGIELLVQRAQAAEDDPDPLGLEYWTELALGTQNAAQAAAAAMRGVSPPPGRKVLLLISGGWAGLPERPLFGFPNQRQEGSPAFDSTGIRARNSFGEPAPLPRAELPRATNVANPGNLFEPVTGTANLLGYTIYPVLLPSHNVSAPGADVLPSSPTPIDELGFLSTPWDRNVNDTMAFVARETGGKLLFNTLRTSAFTRIAADTRSYYGLGFTPAWKADGGNHRISVEVLRPGLKARNRSSFTDLSRGEMAGLKRDSLLLFGVTSQVETVQVETGKPAWAGIGQIKVPVTLNVPARMLTPLAVEGGSVLRARLSMTSRDHGGGSTRLNDVLLSTKLPVAPHPGDFVRYHTTLKLRRAAQTLIFAVLDEEGEGQGRAEIQFQP
jgi:VWFA-related protein